MAHKKGTVDDNNDLKLRTASREVKLRCPFFLDDLLPLPKSLA